MDLKTLVAQQTQVALDPAVGALKAQLLPLVGPVTDEAMKKIGPYVKEEILPKTLFWGGVSLIAAITLGATVGGYFATRRRVHVA